MLLQRVEDAVFDAVEQLVAFCRVSTLDSCIRGVASLIVSPKKALTLDSDPTCGFSLAFDSYISAVTGADVERRKTRIFEIFVG